MSGRDISEEVAKKNNLPKAGVYVVSVEEFSAAEKAGIKAGDLIVAFDGEDVTTMDKLNELKNKHNIGDEVKIKLIRNGEEKEVSITLGERDRFCNSHSIWTCLIGDIGFNHDISTLVFQIKIDFSFTRNDYK